VPEPTSFEGEIVTKKLRRYKSPGANQISAEIVQAGDNTLRSKIHKPTNYVRNKEELPQQRKESIIVPIYKKGDKTDCSNHRGAYLLPSYIQNFIQHSVVHVNSICRRNYWGSSVWIST
jgi:hypothetical protein